MPLRKAHDFRLRKSDKSVNVPGPAKFKVKPNQSYTVRELYDKFARGVFPRNIGKVPVWNEDATLDDVDGEAFLKEDIVDKHEIVKDLRLRAQDSLAEEREKQRVSREAEEAAKTADAAKGNKDEPKQ